MAQQQGRAVQHMEKGTSDLWLPGPRTAPLRLGRALSSVNLSVMPRLPREDCLNNQTGMIQTCHISCGPTEATEFMFKPSQAFPKSGGLDVGFKPITGPELEKNALFPLLSYFLSCEGLRFGALF